MGFVLCAGQLMAGCGEDTPDGLSFALPPTVIDISSASPEWRSAPTGAVPPMVCAGPQAPGTDCCAPPPGVPATAVDCRQYPVACDPTTNLCALTFDVENKTGIDLTRVAEIGAADGRVFARVELTSLRTWVEDAATLPIRTASLFIAPADEETAASPRATLLATLTLTATATSAMPSVEGRQAFAAFARDYRMPFSLWVAAHVVVAGGGTPTGTVKFHVEAHAQGWY